MIITQHVIKLNCTKGAYAYAVKTEDGITLIDTCFPGKGKMIIQELQGHDIQQKDIKRILLTHCDSDHTGNIAYLAENCGCEVFASEEEMPYIKGEKRSKGLRRVLEVLMKTKLPGSLSKLPAGTLAGFEIIKAPGHTPGHLCYRYKNVLFIGDLLRSSKGKLTLSPGIFTWDKAEVLNSCRGLNLDGIDWLCPAHGEPIQTNPAWKTFAQEYLKATM